MSGSARNSGIPLSERYTGVAIEVCGYSSLMYIRTLKLHEDSAC